MPIHGALLYYICKGKVSLASIQGEGFKELLGAAAPEKVQGKWGQLNIIIMFFNIECTVAPSSIAKYGIRMGIRVGCNVNVRRATVQSTNAVQKCRMLVWNYVYKSFCSKYVCVLNKC